MEEETKELVDIQKPKKKNVLWIVLSVLFGVLTFAVLAFFIADVVLNVNYFVVEVSGISMERTLQNEDYLYAKKRFTVERGDIVIIDVENHREGTFFGEDTEFIIKRVIGMEGDTVRISEEGAVCLKYADAADFVLLEESYVSAPTVTYGTDEWTVGEGQIFFMGDNRTDSYDSRRVGCFETADVVGVVPQWSVDMKRLTTGWERFRSALRGQDAPSKGQ